MPVDHYENFPVASILLPKRFRSAVEAIYAFARSADDLADEGDAPAEQRIASLNAYEAELDLIVANKISMHPIFARLATAINGYQLPIEPFRDLLSAFRQDVVTTRYDDFSALLDYCRRSADPVGRLMLALYGVEDAHSLSQSNAICSALQLINFWQDIAIDWQKKRIYLPLSDMRRFGVTPAHLTEQRCDVAWRQLLAFEVTRAHRLLESGAPLALRLPGRLGWELRLVVQGGLRILARIEAVGYDVFRHRPVLGATDWAYMVWGAMCMRKTALFK